MTLAAHRPSALRALVLSGSAGRPAEVTRFLGALTGALPVRSYFSAAATARRLGGHLLRRPAAATA